VSDLPPGWASTTLGEIADPRTQQVEPGARPGDLFNCVGLEDVEPGTGRLLAPQPRLGKTIGSSKFAFNVGDVVYGKLRPYLRKVFIADVAGVSSTDLLPLRPRAGMDAGYLRWLLLSPLHSDYIAPLMAGIRMPRLRSEDIRDMPLPLPPAGEQRRIVAKIDELMAQSRRARKAMDAVPPLLDKLRQSVLAAAFRGDLTADWRAAQPDVEAANGHIACLRAERRARWEAGTLQSFAGKGKRPRDDDWRTRYKAPAEPDIDGMPELPSGWAWASLDAICWDSGYGTSVKCDYDGQGPPVMRIPNIASGRIDLGDVKRAVGDLGLLPGEVLAPADFLVVRTNGSKDLIGRAACVEDVGRGAYFASYLIRFRLLGPRALWQWVTFWWQSPWIRNRIEALAATSAGQYNVSLTELSRLPVPIPSASEIDEIVSALEAAIQSMAGLAQTTAEEQRRLDALAQSLLAKAFRGELVSQDPNDEPASVLLERIRQERDASVEGEGRRPRAAKSKPQALKIDAARVSPVNPTKVEPATEPTQTAPTGAQKDLLDGEIDQQELFDALWLQGPMEKDAAVRSVAEHLRSLGRVDYRRLRVDGPLYKQIQDAIDENVKRSVPGKAGVTRPRRGYVLAGASDPSAYEPVDWRDVLLKSLGEQPIDRDDAIRKAAEWARDNCGLVFERLRSDGQIVTGLRSAINSAIRQKLVVRVDAQRIARAPSAERGDDRAARFVYSDEEVATLVVEPPPKGQLRLFQKDPA